MRNHKYFSSNKDYDFWIKCNSNIEVVDIKQVSDGGVYIYYIQPIFKPKIKKRNRIW